jgi:hypothetical protein
MTEETKSYYFTFGFGHSHRVNGITFDCDIVVEIEGTFITAREKMFKSFGNKWCAQYETGEFDLEMYPRGVHKL